MQGRPRAKSRSKDQENGFSKATFGSWPTQATALSDDSSSDVASRPYTAELIAAQQIAGIDRAASILIEKQHLRFTKESPESVRNIDEVVYMAA